MNKNDIKGKKMVEVLRPNDKTMGFKSKMISNDKRKKITKS